MKWLTRLTLLCTPLLSLSAQMHHNTVDKHNIKDNSFYLAANELEPFEELMISWNGLRPKSGHYSVYVSVDTGTWSDWLLYATWGSDFQRGNKTPKTGAVRIYQDAVAILGGNQGRGFKLKIVAQDGALISDLRSIHVCASQGGVQPLITKPTASSLTSYKLDVKGISQMALPDPRCKRLCSPTSTTSVVRFLSQDTSIDPISFAEKCWDAKFDIFGNWVFNVAAAYEQINNPAYSCWVDRLDSFDTVLDSLKEGMPIVISVRSPLPGNAIHYGGHLITIIGFDHLKEEVICMDSAFSSDDKTIVRYKFVDLMAAWNRRGNVAYMFKKSN